MRTLKRSLSLVLALVMVLGLCVVGANASYADYTDKDTINYADAVEVLTGLGVIEGRTDGSFDPTATVTRAEACAMICRMMLGREGADKLPVGDVKFNDVSLDSWEGRMAKYIAFCANRGIVVGDGNGNFRPNDPVKGTELACMLLRALGYGVMGEYEGKGWDINAVADALYYKVFKDSEVTDFSQYATREETALYVFNTLFVDLVAYDVDIDHYVLDLGNFALNVYNMKKVEGVQVEANQATGEKYTVINGKNYDIETGLDLIAHEVTLYYDIESKDKDKQNNTFWKAWLVQDNSTILQQGSTWASMYKALKDENKDNAIAPYSKLADVDVWVNYVYTSAPDVTLADVVKTTSVANMKGYDTQNNNVSTYGSIVLDSDGHMLAFMMLEYTVDQVKKIVDDEIILRVNKYSDDFDAYYLEYAYEGIAKGDYVTVQPVGKLCYIYPTSTQEVDVYERSVFVDYLLIGLEIPYFNFFSIGPSQGYRALDPDGTEDPFNIAAGDKVLFYMDYYGKFWAAEILERGTLEGVVYVNEIFQKKGEDDYGDPDNTVYIQAVNEKGEEVVYPLNKDVYKSTTAVANGVYKVYTDKKGYAKLSAVGGQLDKVEGKTTYLTSDGDNYYVTKDTKIYYLNGKKADLKITTAKALPAAGSYKVWAYYTKSSNTYNCQVLWVVGQKAPKTSDSYIYVAGDSYKSKSLTYGGSMVIADETAYYFALYIDGVKSNATFVANEDISAPGPFASVKCGFYIYSVDENGIYDLDAVEDSDVLKVKTVTLTAGDVKNGKFYVDCDGVKIDCSVVVPDKKGAISNDGKKYLTFTDLDDIQDLLDDGGTVTVTYLAAVSNADEIPFGTIYVIEAHEAPEA